MLEFEAASLAIMILTAIAVAGVILWVFYARGKLAKQERQERAAAERFEQNVLRSLSRAIPSAGNESPAVSPSRVQEPRPESPPCKTGTEKTSAAGFDGPHSGDEAVAPAAFSSGGRIEGVIGKLQAAGLLDVREGPLVLEGGLPPAQLLRLRNGKRVAVFPPGTPPAMTASHRKMVDYLFLVQEDGSALACQSLSDFIANLLFPS